jgi:hypothetical protein
MMLRLVQVFVVLAAVAAYVAVLSRGQIGGIL